MSDDPMTKGDGAEPATPVELERYRGRAVLRRDAQALLSLELVPAEGEAYFVLDEDGLGALDDALRRVGRETAVGGLVVHGDARGFVAGADVGLIRAVTDPALAAEFARRGQRCFQGYADLPFPTVAAIHGPCLGGGLELALALDHRVASRDPSTKLGLPEVQLGILPGFGGTQRLPLLLGLPAALDLMLTGKTLDGERARRRGLVDACVPSSRLLERAAGIALSPPAQRRKLGLRDSLLSFHRPGRALVRRKVQKQLGQGPARFFLAPRRLLDVAILGLERLPEGAYEAEALALGELAVGDECKSLVGLFFERERARKLDRELDPAGEAAPVERALVVGGGVMGAGIAALMASRGVRVRLVDVAAAALAAAVGRLRKALDKRLRRRRLQPHEHQAALDRLEVSTLRVGHRRADLVLEAVAEDLGLKRRLFAEAAERGAGDQLLATNTSSLPLAAMAEGLPRPERLIGLHFFNPPEQMPLVELIAHAGSSAAALARGARLAAGLGKSPVLVADRPGFLVNRCLAPYLAQAVALVEEGVAAQEVDAVAEAHGMPMGPLRLLDEIGWDVAAKVCAVLGEAFPVHMQASKLFGAMVEA
ncbi:MAG: 3-hydroxyacyl-CoA dehydrogenase NAD-binding domain-containing protein, partial [Planctomycetota bacterium]